MKKKYFMLSEGLEASKKAKQAEEAKNIVDYLKSIGDYKQAERISTGSPNLTLTSNHLFQLNTDKLSKLLKEYPSVKITRAMDKDYCN
ncbi:MAG: hypothetical protein K0Q51_1341 [Rickettsiaceae bacterium]|jgi:hypothetical protein|nr:hypothetical protein [Rickettsiaceae bacterium]